MKNKTKLIVGIAVAVIVGLFAYNKVNAEESIGDFSLGYNSDLIFRGVGADESAIQSSIGLGTNVLGVDLDVGASVNVKDVGDDEVRLSAQTGVELFETVNTSVGVVNYNNNHAIGDGTELFISLGAEIILSPEVKLFYNPSEQYVTTEGSISHSVTVTEQVSVGAVGTVGNTTIGGDSGFYYGLDVIVDYSINDNTSAYIGINLQDVQDINFEAPELAFVGGVNHRF